MNQPIGPSGKVNQPIGPSGDQGSIPKPKIKKKWYLISAWLTHSIIRYVSRVKWGNPGKGVVLFPTLQCSSYWKGSLRVALDYSHQKKKFLPWYCHSLFSLLLQPRIELSIQEKNSSMHLHFDKRIFVLQVYSGTKRPFGNIFCLSFRFAFEASGNTSLFHIQRLSPWKEKEEKNRLKIFIKDYIYIYIYK